MHGNSNGHSGVSTIHCAMVRRDGVEFGIECRVTNVAGPSGHQFGAVMAIRDVSKALADSRETSRGRNTMRSRIFPIEPCSMID